MKSFCLLFPSYENISISCISHYRCSVYNFFLSFSLRVFQCVGDDNKQNIYIKKLNGWCIIFFWVTYSLTRAHVNSSFNSIWTNKMKLNDKEFERKTYQKSKWERESHDPVKKWLENSYPAAILLVEDFRRGKRPTWLQCLYRYLSVNQTTRHILTNKQELLFFPPHKMRKFTVIAVNTLCAP